MSSRAITTALLAGISCAAFAGAALADKLTHSTAVFSGLDKITGRIISFDVAVGETVQFGSLQITPNICYTRPQTEAPQTDGFIEVDEITADNEYKRIFSGWMFAASPGLHGIEHPVYDVWLTDCKGPGQLIASAPEAAAPNDDDLAGKGTPTGRATGRPAQRQTGQQGQQGQPPGTAPRQPQQALPVPPPAPPAAPQGFSSAPIEVGPPPGSRSPTPPPAQRRQPSQQFFPTTSQPVPFDRNAPGGGY